jgi:hypothetical protein
MYYQTLSNLSTPTKIYLVFNEIEITPNHQNFADFHQPGKYVFKKYRHADGSLNATSELFQMWLDQGTNSDPFILPAYDFGGISIDKNYILQNVQKHFEIFDIEVLESSLPNLPVAWGRPQKDPNINPGPRYIKILPTNVTPNFYSSLFNSLPSKFYPFKRAVWWQLKEDSAIFNCAMPWNNFALIGFEFSLLFGGNDIKILSDNLIGGILHELGHCYNLDHQGDRRYSPKTVQGSYYGARSKRNPDWAPIMGYVLSAPKFMQWSNTDYKHGVVATASQEFRTPAYANELVDMLQGGAKLLKSPGYSFKATTPGPGSRGHRGATEKGTKTKDALYARYATSTELFGMIGYEKDYDIIEVLVSKGFSQFTVQADTTDNGNKSQLDTRIEVLYCQAHVGRPQGKPDSYYPDIWIPNKNDIPGLKNKNIFHRVEMENDGNTSKPKNIHSIGSKSDVYSSTVSVNTNYLTMVYLKIMGNWSGTVNPVTKKPLEEDKGYSNYGSFGKYKLSIFGGGNPIIIKEESYSLPYGRFEEFSYCKNGQYSTEWLLVQHLGDSSQGDPSKENMWVLELDTVNNGQIQKKKFIVFGEPIDINAEEKPGKFYLPVIIDGKCKKQEFIVGMPRPEEE